MYNTEFIISTWEIVCVICTIVLRSEFDYIWLEARTNKKVFKNIRSNRVKADILGLMGYFHTKNYLVCQF